MQRIRDPLHGLIVFDRGKPLDRLVFDLMGAQAFQRLRRIKQLGVSEFVFPGATHSRFMHSLGVFAIARQLADIVDRELNRSPDWPRLNTALVASLLHDIGHGPFSHAFESVSESLGNDKRHEDWSAEIILRDPEIRGILDSFSDIANLADEIANLVRGEQRADIYSAIVSSQFDADRLDYLQRDRAMTGVGYGGFDWDWLRNNLVVRRVSIPSEGQGEGETSARSRELHTFVLRAKAHEGIEGYVLARWHLYRQVYFHKTVRAAEKMLTILLTDVASVAQQDCADRIGLPRHHPLVRYFGRQNPGVDDYLELDDAAVGGALHLIASGEELPAAELARSLLNRRFFKKFELPAWPGREQAAINRIREACSDGRLDRRTVAWDRLTLKGYSGADDPAKAILVEGNAPGQFHDLAAISPVVASLKPATEFRLYCRDADVYRDVCSVLGSDFGKTDGEEI